MSTKEEILKERVDRAYFPDFNQPDIQSSDGSFVKFRKTKYGLINIQSMVISDKCNCIFDDCKNKGKQYAFGTSIQEYFHSIKYSVCDKHLDEMIKIVIKAAVRFFEHIVVNGYNFELVNKT